MRHRFHRTALVIAAGGLGLGLFGGSMELLSLQSSAVVTVTDGMPSQAAEDLSSSTPGLNLSTGGWADWSAGVAARPYVTSLSLINGGVSTPIVTGGTVASSEITPPVDGITTVISPLNLCRANQTPGAGCYSTPNRVEVTVGYGKPSLGGTPAAGGNPVGYNFAPRSTTAAPTINASTIVDMTVALNTVGQNLRWSWVDGDLSYWQVTNPGLATASVHLRFKLASAPYIASPTPGSGCTATPIFNCTVQSADNEVLTGSVVFSLDNTLPASLTGAVFATQDAIFGYLTPGGTATAPTVDIQESSSHFKSDGTPQSGVLEAFLPSSTLLNLYGLLPGDAASTLSVTRTEATGSNGTPTTAVWCSDTCPAGTTGTAGSGSDGVFITVPAITFSVPTYVLAGTLKAYAAHVAARSGKTHINSSIGLCKKSNKCAASIYDLGPSTSSLTPTAKLVLKNTSVPGRKLSLTVRSSKLKKGDRFLLQVRSRKLGKVITSTVGTVN